MFENAVERELMERLRGAGAAGLASGLSPLLDGAGVKAVSSLGDGQFRVLTIQGFYEVPGSYAGIMDSLREAAGICGYDVSGEGPSGGLEAYILTPRA